VSGVEIEQQEIFGFGSFMQRFHAIDEAISIFEDAFFRQTIEKRLQM